MKEKFKLPEQAIRLWFWLFAVLCLIAAIAMPDRWQMVEGMLRLCTLPYQSANSYFDASGGGFAGVIMAMIPNDLVDEYTEYIENAIGEGNVYRMSIRPHGAICVSERI